MEARKAKINTIINNMTLLEIPFFKGHMYGIKIFGKDF